MTSGGESKNHHWWPKGLQRYWTDANDCISWIQPDGSIKSDRRLRGSVGHILHGHTLSRGDAWHLNFEDYFSIDTKVHDLIGHLSSLVPEGYTQGEIKTFHINDLVNRQLTLFIFALLIRSPSSRHLNELYPTMIGLPANPEVGKANMRQKYTIARQLCENGVPTNRNFAILHSEDPTFIHGDGCLDWLSGGLSGNRITGRALLALTPHLCVYLSTPTRMRSDRNCTAIRATTAMVERANEITQIYAKERLFFLGKPPHLTADFRRAEFLQHATFSESLLNEIDVLTGHSEGRRGFLSSSW